MKKNKIVLGSAIALTLLAISSQKENINVKADNSVFSNNTTTPSAVSIKNEENSLTLTTKSTTEPAVMVDCSIVISPSEQNVKLGEDPIPIKITHNNDDGSSSDDNTKYRYIYTTDGSDPTLDNINIGFVSDYNDSSSFRKYIKIFPRYEESVINIKIQGIKHDVVTNEDVMFGGVQTATVSFVKGESVAPIVSPVNQIQNVEDLPHEIMITKDDHSGDTHYYYTLNNTTPTENSPEIMPDNNYDYKIQVPTQNTEGMVNVNVIAVNGSNNPSPVTTAHVKFQQNIDKQAIDYTLTPVQNPMPNRLYGARIKIADNMGIASSNEYDYIIYNENDDVISSGHINNDDEKIIYIPYPPNTDNSNKYTIVATAKNTIDGYDIYLTKNTVITYSAKEYSERTPEPIVVSHYKFVCNSTIDNPPSYFKIKNVKPNTKYYIASARDGYKFPLISDEYELKPNDNGEYIIQPPALDVKYNTYITYNIIAVEDGKAPSSPLDLTMSYEYEPLNDVIITPSLQTATLNEKPKPIIISFGDKTFNGDGWADIYCLYTLDGSKPTFENSFKAKLDESDGYKFIIQPPSQSEEKTISLNIRMLESGDGADIYKNINTATIEYVKAKTDTPTLSPITQTVPVGSYADTIYVTNVNKNNNIKLYYTTDGSIPNTSSKQCYFDYDGKYRINVGTQSKPTTEKLNVIAVEDNKSPSDVATATVIYSEQTAEPVLTPEYSGVDMGKTPTPIVIDKDNPRLDVDYYYTTDGSQPTISNGYKVLPNENGSYVIQPPTLDSKEDEYFKIRVIAIEKNKAPSNDVDASVQYLYHEPIILTPKTQTKLINETPDTIYITQDSYDCNSIDFSKMIYFRYTTDGTEPTMLNGQSVFFDKNTNHASIHIPTQDKTGIVTIKVKRVIRNIKPMDLVTNDYIDTRYYTDYIRDNTAIATVNFVPENVDSPILNPTTQTKYTGETPDAIKIENVSENTKYYFTTDGTIPTMNSKEIVADKNNNYEIQIPTQTTDGKVNVKVIAVKNNNQSNITDAEVIFKSKDTPITPVTPPITTDPTPTPTPSHSSRHHNSELKLIDVYKNDYIKNTDTKVSENNYTWNNTTDNLTGTLEYTDNCYTVKMDKDFDKGTHVVIYDNFKDKPAKLYSYLPDIGIYALLKDDVTATDGTLKFDTTNKGEYVITANELPKDKVLKYWYSLGYNKWIFFNKYSDERLIGWHKAQSGEWVHNGIDSMGDSFHMADNTIMDMGWFKDKDGSWYYLDNLSRDGINSYGAVLKGWYYLDNNWYYFNLDSGKMTTGWCKINNNWYYFNSDGAMQSNTTIDGYQLNEHGQLV